MAKAKAATVLVEGEIDEVGKEGREGKRYYSTSGRARKQCPKCKQFVASALAGKLCYNPECDYEFPAREAKEDTGGRQPREEAGGLTLEDLWVLEDKLAGFMATEIGEGKAKAKLTPVQLLQFVNDVDEMQVQVGGIGNLVKFIQRQIDKAAKDK